jgi:hypothetical protein
MRPKWDEIHYGDGRTYGEGTIEEALAFATDRYDPEHAGDEIDVDVDGGAATDSPGKADHDGVASDTTARSPAPTGSPTDHADDGAGESVPAPSGPAEDGSTDAHLSGPVDGGESSSDDDEAPATAGAETDADDTREVPADATVVYGEPAAVIDELRASLEALVEENQDLRERLAAAEADRDAEGDGPRSDTDD